MEIVYLWVEQYKNIQKQGFNFSPSFDCSYETNKLVINPKNNFNIFPENINVTTIVGENGSGKSNILEIITLLRFEKLERNKNNFIIVYLYKDVFYTLCNNGKSYDEFGFLPSKFIINKTDKRISNNSLPVHKWFCLSYFSTPLVDLSNFDELIKSNHYDSFYNGCGNGVSFNKKFAYLLGKRNNFFHLIDKSYIFDSMRLEINFKKLTFDFVNEDIKLKVKSLKYYFENNIDTSSWIMGEKKYEHVKEDFIFNFFASYFLEKYIYVYNDFYSQFNDDFKKKYKKSFFDDFIDEIERYINEKEKNSTSIPYNILILTLLKGKYKELKQVIYKIFEDHRGQIDHFKGLTNELEVLENYEKYSKYISENFELQENTNLLLSKIDLVKEKDINDYYKIADENRFFSELFSYEKLYINFLDSTSHITYNQLSTGEKSLITFFSNYTYTLILRNENRIILIDEVESFLHPRWQKEIIHLLIEYIQYLEKEELIKINRFHLIVTSHSPFLLSDIPKDNIIFLEKGKEVYPFTKEEQTFGANIHTLMSHGFFMKKSGLMGKFAQNQINKVIEDLQKKETILSQQKIKSIIEIVGEPFLKYKLMQMYNDKFPLEDEISELEYENKILEKKQRKNAERIKSLKEEEGKNATT